MFVTDDYVLYTAPKCGSSSLVQTLRGKGLQTATHMVHDVHWSNDFSGRKIIVTARHPRERLLSIWKHLINEIGNDSEGFERFAFQVQHPDYYMFFRKTLCDWYRLILPHITDVIRLETIQEDCDRLLKVGTIKHVGKTQHATWSDEMKKDKRVKAWVNVWAQEDIAVFYPGAWK